MSEKNIEISMWYDRISEKNSDTHLLFGQKSYLSIFLVKYVGFEEKGGSWSCCFSTQLLLTISGVIVYKQFYGFQLKKY